MWKYSSHHSSRVLRLVALSLATIWLPACSHPKDDGPPAVPSTAEPGPTSAPVAAAPAVATNPSEPRPKIVAFGDSLTAGFGLEKSKSYPAFLQELLDEQGYHYEVVNAGVSGETSAGGLRRIDHALGDDDVRVVIVELGGNDGLRGLPPKDLEKNLGAIVEKAKKRGVRVLLTGMEAPPYLGDEYTSAFRAVYPALAEREHVAVMPFFLADVAANPDLNQLDGIHPNERGAKIVAANVLRSLEPLLRK